MSKSSSLHKQKKEKEVKKLFDKKLTRPPINFEELFQREEDLKIFRDFTTKFKSEPFVDLKIFLDEIKKEKEEEKQKKIIEKINFIIKEKKSIFDEKKFKEIEKEENFEKLKKILKEYSDSSLNYLFFRFRSNREWKEFSKKKYKNSNKLFEDIYKITSKIKKINENIYQCSILERKKNLEFFCQIKSLDTEEEAENYFQKVLNLKNKIKEPNENLIELFDIYNEQSDLELKKFDVILVLTNIKINMNDFIEENRSMNTKFKHFVKQKKTKTKISNKNRN